MLLQTALTSLIALAVLLLLTKLVGNRQLSELNMFDYIVSITIGSIAAEMATELERPERPLVAMAVFTAVSLIISAFTAKFMKLRRLLFGRSVFLMKDGKLFRENFKKSRLDLSEFLMQCRLNGYYDLGDLDTAVMEPNGKISFLPTAKSRVVTTKDMNLTPKENGVLFNVVMDGEILKHNLKVSGLSESALQKKMAAQGLKLSEIFLAVTDAKGRLRFYKNEGFQKSNDFFE